MQRVQKASPTVHEVLRSPGHSLDATTRAHMEPQFGCDFSGVRVHTDAAAGRSASDVNAHAYTVGNDIVFAAGRFAPESRAGRRLLAHELTHVVQQRGGTTTLQRQPVTPAPNAERDAAIRELEAVANVTTQQLEAQSDAEDALKLKWRRRSDRNYAWSLGLKDRARLQKRHELSLEMQQEIAVKLNFFRGDAKAAYLRTISPALSSFPSGQVIEILNAPPGAGLTSEQPSPLPACDVSKHEFPLEYEGEPDRNRCMDIRTDPEFTRNYFDSNIKSAVGYAVEGTTWENVEYGRFHVMLVNYVKGGSEYFMLDEVGNFHYGDTSHITLSFSFLKRHNGLVYPFKHGRLYSNEDLTPTLIANKNGLEYQTKELQGLYTLLQVAGAYASIMGAYGAGVGPFKASINAFRRKPPTTLPGKPLPRTITKQKSEKSGIPEPISDEATTQRIRQGRVGEIVGDFEIAGDKGLRGTTFVRNIYGISNVHGPAPSKTLNIKPIMQLFRSFIQEAKTSGATQLKITGNVIRNPNVLRLGGVARSFGGTFRRTGPMEIEITIPIK